MKTPTFGSGPSGSANSASVISLALAILPRSLHDREIQRTGYFTRWQLAAHLRYRTTDRDLQGRDIERGHVVLSATLVVVVDDVFPHVVIRAGVLYVRLSSSVVNDEYQHENCNFYINEINSHSPIKRDRYQYR